MDAPALLPLILCCSLFKYLSLSFLPSVDLWLGSICSSIITVKFVLAYYLPRQYVIVLPNRVPQGLDFVRIRLDRPDSLRHDRGYVCQLTQSPSLPMFRRKKSFKRQMLTWQTKFLSACTYPPSCFCLWASRVSTVSAILIVGSLKKNRLLLAIFSIGTIIFMIIFVTGMFLFFLGPKTVFNGTCEAS